jgi:O-antigen/teichoic acid export membrane protein
MPSIRNNFLYKTLLTISSYIIGFITFPYVSRVLGVDGIGAVNFTDNTVGYFILFASMGIAILGTREIAAAKDDQAKRNRVFSNLLGLNILFTIITLIIYLGIIVLVPRFSQSAEMFYIGAAKIIATVFLVEWFFTGLEEFRFITLRSIAIKLLYVVAVFTLIDDKSDYKLYFTLSVASVIINALVNIVYARKFVKINRQALFSMRYLKEYVTLGIYSIMTSMYITFNVMYLGLSSDNTQVGYYTTAFKLYIIMLGVFSAFTSVTMPRISAMLAEGQHDNFTQIVAKSFDGIIKFILPLIICGVILAPQIIFVISGEGFEGAILPMRIIFPAALAVGIAQVLAVQVLIPLKRDKVLLTASIIGASASLIINILLVPYLQSVGSAIVTLAAESIVTLTYIIYTLRKKVVKLPFATIGKNALYAIPPAIVCLICSYTIKNPFICVATAVVVGGGIWIASNFKTLREYLR